MGLLNLGPAADIVRGYLAAEVVAQLLVQGKTHSLEGHALGDIQGWADSDEAIMQAMRAPLRDGKPLPPTPGGEKLYAAHLVSAAVMEALATGKDIGKPCPSLASCGATTSSRKPCAGCVAPCDVKAASSLMSRPLVDHMRRRASVTLPATDAARRAGCRRAGSS